MIVGCFWAAISNIRLIDSRRSSIRSKRSSMALNRSSTASLNELMISLNVLSASGASFGIFAVVEDVEEDESEALSVIVGEKAIKSP